MGTRNRASPLSNGGIVGSSWFDFALLEERQLFAKEEVLGSQSATGMRARKARRSRSTTTEETVRKQCATVRISGKPSMNAQDDTLQNVTGSQLRVGRTFCGAQLFRLAKNYDRRN